MDSLKNERKRTNNKGRLKEAYLEFLMMVYEDTKDGGKKVSLNNYVKLVGIDSTAGTVAKDCGLVVGESRGRKGYYYTWNTIRPNLHMAEELIHRVREKRRQYSDIKKAEQAIMELTADEKPEVEAVEQQTEAVKQPKKSATEFRPISLLESSKTYKLWFFKFSVTTRTISYEKTERD